MTHIYNHMTVNWNHMMAWLVSHDHSHGTHVRVKAGEDDLPLVSVAVYHFQDNVGHLIALKVAEVVLRVCGLWYRVFHLNVEANMWRKISEDLLVCLCSCVSVNVHGRKDNFFPNSSCTAAATAVPTHPHHYQHTHAPSQELEMFFFPEVLQNMVHNVSPSMFRNSPLSYSKTPSLKVKQRSGHTTE